MIVTKKSFTPAPEGPHAAVLVDDVDLGDVTGVFGTKHKVRLTWELAAKMKDGRPFIISKQYTASLHKKSGLSKDLASWRGRALTDAEAKAFELDKLIGICCLLVIQHQEKDGETYSNIIAITKLPKDQWIRPSGQYVRAKDRPNENGNGTKQSAPADYDDFGGNPTYSDQEPPPSEFSDEDPSVLDGSGIPF